MAIILANNAKSTLAAAIGALDTTLTVTSGTETLFPSPTGGDYFYVTLEDSTKTIREIVKCTARGTTTLTIVRAQDGTLGNTFAIGSTVEMRVNKATITDTISAATSAASAAATSASAAATSASAASTSASSASTSAGTATTQAGIATTQATNASNSATSAASSASAAAASAASGMYSAVQDKNANYTIVAADAGDLIRVTTTSGAITITLPLISGTGIGDGFKIAVVKWTSDANAVNIARSGSDTINGATSAQIGSQYSQIVFVADLETSQWFASQSGLGATNINVDPFSGNGSTTAFTLTSDPSTKNNTAVYISGVYQQKSTYSVSGTTLTFTTAPPTGTSNIEVAYSTPLAIGTPSDGTVTTAKIASSVTLTTPTIDTITSAASTALTLKSAGTTAVYVDTSQNVGIGTTTTSNATLTVNNANLTSPLYIGSQSDSLSWGGFFVNGATSSTAGNGIYGKSGASFYYNVATGLNHIWTTNGAEKMRIDSSGNLLVGTTSNTRSARLRVEGQETAYFTGYGNGYGIGLWMTPNASATGGTADPIKFQNVSNTTVGSISTTASATAFNTSSDYRLKNTIAPMTGALAKVALLKPVTYKWNVDGSDSQGFIAHELAEVVPQCVTGEKDAVDVDGNPEYQGIDTSFLVATLTSAIQELKAINDTQAETLSQQATLINALTTRITALENK